MKASTRADTAYIMELSEAEVLCLRQLLRNLARIGDSPMFGILDSIEDGMAYAGWPKAVRPSMDFTFALPHGLPIPGRAE